MKYIIHVSLVPRLFPGEGKEPVTHCMRMHLIKARVWVGRIVDDVEKSSVRR